ncbi:hypothetical protein UFOVP276_193 [uncultured Caudovirales phage]|uniref:Uncharacterized protein n=1 Tax=uncultured Caudovirales phage TaxID=2100421 RepID=A0A6J5LQF3_9CAUD|nr:hypothetical protein UFOVP127_87 [uncultured Caudovirales phage]CAB4135237.1 hypothetical protein UFOVP276_193 [uncultured Caudovirales phage]
MKKLIVRQQVIDCNKETCGKCDYLTFGHDPFCFFWHKLLSMNGKLVVRAYECKNAEMSTMNVRM